MRTSRTPLLAAGGVAALAVVAFLAFGVFGVHTLFIDEQVDEANPFVVASDTTVAATSSAAEDDESTAEILDDVADETEDATAETTTPTTAPVVETLTTGTFVSNEHPTEGSGFTLGDGDRIFLRFENFETDNGPDLNVYLRSSADPDDYLDLGDLKGNIGDQNYELPADIDLDRYDLVDIWCVRFGVSFGSAQLA
ncbi:MAG: DM13 domain-containing protein [Acidimicrobiales bacterium]